MRRAVIASKAMIATVLAMPIPLISCAPDVVDDVGLDLVDAAKSGQTERVKALLDAGLEVGAENGIGSTALLAAALNGHTETVKALLDVGVDINGKDENGETALIRA